MTKLFTSKDFDFSEAVNKSAAFTANQKVQPLLDQCEKMRAALRIYCLMSPRTLAGDDTTWVAKTALSDFDKYLKTIKGE